MRDALLDQLSKWRPFRALVVGDFMLDRHVYGDAERLSADAPVPILAVRRVEERPGGAANVCLALAALGGQVRAAGLIGMDSAAESLCAALGAAGVDTGSLVRDPGRPTTLKENLVGLAQARHPQKMFRVDYESAEPIGRELADQLLDRLERVIPEVDVVCIEDYRKGVCADELCREIIRVARSAGKPVFVDPARIADYSKYRGATAITPNRTEAEFATGMSTHGHSDAAHSAPLAAKLLAELALEAVVLTLDRHGALLTTREESGRSIPTVARQVYDVTGAGDEFLAALAAARANTIGWPDAVRFANAAAGLEVEAFGVQPIPFERVHSALLAMASDGRGKLRTLEEACVEASALRREGRKVVFTNGCFDVLHAGHTALLARARAEGDHLVVGLNDDGSVRRLKGEGRPVNSQEDRARVLGALASVDAVVLFGADTPMDLIERLRPDVLVKGADYTRSTVVGAELVESYGGKVVLAELVEGRSTTETIRRAGMGAGEAQAPSAP